ncbi:hypothetical protein F5Y17DRAFT_79715 [Xylariaceae sp. FL0594]|nr:hypothetical protein F5Y17DRAFT_79715 [Xylariaceae sp. FL0594]
MPTVNSEKQVTMVTLTPAFDPHSYPTETNNYTVTSYLPLTTVYFHSALCSGCLPWERTRLVAFDPGYGIDSDLLVRCLSTPVTTWWEQGRFSYVTISSGQPHTALSLGPLVCPYAWSTLVSSVKDQSSTLALCCPSGYHLANGVPGSVIGDCHSDVEEGDIFIYQSTQWDDDTAWEEATTTLTASSAIAAIPIVGCNINRPAVPSSSTSDSSSTITTPASTSSLASSESATTTSSSHNNPGVMTNNNNNNKDTLSTKAAIGLGVGIGFGLLLILTCVAAVVMLTRRRRRTTGARARRPLSPTA